MMSDKWLMIIWEIDQLQNFRLVTNTEIPEQVNSIK